MIIEIKNLSKKYSKGNFVLNNINIVLKEKGKIYGLIGPNGAGKTTLIRILTTQLLITSGSVKVLGFDILKDKKKIRKKISVLPQDIIPFLYELNLYDYIYFYLKIRGYSKANAKDRTEEIIKTCHLEKEKFTELGNLSGGYLRRSFLAMALSVDCDIYFLDEPTVGLDPVSRRQIWEIIQKKAHEEGKVIFITSHYMEEISGLCDELMVISKNGEVKQFNSPSEFILKYFNGANKKIIVKLDYKIQISEFNHLKEILVKYGKSEVNNNLIISFPQNYSNVIDELSKLNISYEISSITLEDALIDMEKK